MKKILIVDDHAWIRDLVKITLGFDDHKILAAEDGQQALEIVHKEHPDIILLDVMMPNSELSGLELCRRLKTDPATADIHIIIVSASGEQHDIEAGKRAGANDYLTKPFSPIALIEKVEEAASMQF